VDSSFHILGDSAYPLEKCLLVPYRGNGHLNQKQKQFNYHLLSSRCAIETAFTLLKGKFSRLKYLDVNDIAAVPAVVTAACVLHNCILQNETATGDLQTDSQDVTDGDTRVPCDCSAQVVLNTTCAELRSVTTSLADYDVVVYIRTDFCYVDYNKKWDKIKVHWISPDRSTILTANYQKMPQELDSVHTQTQTAE